jgi:hypothetical protein
VKIAIYYHETVQYTRVIDVPDGTPVREIRDMVSETKLPHTQEFKTGHTWSLPLWREVP